MKKKPLVWLIISLVLGIGIISVFAFNPNNEEISKDNQEPISKKIDNQNGDEARKNQGSETLKETEIESGETLPTTEELEKQLVLGEGTLPQEITMSNTKIFEKNGINDVFAMQLQEGALTEPTKGTILSDEVCEPDEYGYYHCWNNIELSNGKTIRVLGIHDMKGGIPCQSPDTEVVVTPYKDGYILLKR